MNKPKLKKKISRTIRIIITGMGEAAAVVRAGICVGPLSPHLFSPKPD